MIDLILQKFGGRGGSSGGGGGGAGGSSKNAKYSEPKYPTHEEIEDMFALLTSVDMGYQANEMIEDYRDLYEKFLRGEPFEPNYNQGAILNGIIVNYNTEGYRNFTYSQTYDLNTVQIQDKSASLEIVRDAIKEKFDSGEYSYTRFAREEREKMKSSRSRKR